MKSDKNVVYLVLLLISYTSILCCRAFECQENQVKCDDAKCLDRTLVCNGVTDCLDATDELNCQARKEEHYPVYYFQCSQGDYIPRHWLCDREDDCGDNSDEYGCFPEEDCHDGGAQCQKVPQCLNATNGVNCSSPTTPLPEEWFQCNSSSMVTLREWVCDGFDDCNDGSDEKDCNDSTHNDSTNSCRSYEFQCGFDCIDKSWVCDGTEHCLNGIDEANCSECHSDQFQCADKQKCIPADQLCNAHTDCEDGSDEINCGTLAPKSKDICNLTSHFLCEEGRCIQKEMLCDGSNDCGNMEDENDDNCGTSDCVKDEGGGCKQYCSDGYRLTDNKECEDIDECSEVTGICSQNCINTNGSFKCSCQPGYEQVPSDNTRCKAVSGEPYLIFSYRSQINKLRLKDGQMSEVVPSARGATAFDYIFKNQQVIWSNDKDKEIVRGNISDPEDYEVIFKGERVSPGGLAVDWIHNNVYFTDTGNFKVHMMSLDSNWTKTFTDELVDEPRAIAVSPLDGYIFWTSWGKAPKIERVELDGSGRIAIVEEPHVYWPNGITVDYDKNQIYWCDGKLHQINKANFDGTMIEVVLSSPTLFHHPYSISVFEDSLYWTDWQQSALWRANKFTGENIKEISTSGSLAESPKVVHVFHEYRQPTGKNVCSSRQCSHMCVRSPLGAPVCVCPDDTSLSTKNPLTCITKDASHNSSLSPNTTSTSLDISTSDGSTTSTPLDITPSDGSTTSTPLDITPSDGSTTSTPQDITTSDGSTTSTSQDITTSDGSTSTSLAITTSDGSTPQTPFVTPALAFIIVLTVFVMAIVGIMHLVNCKLKARRLRSEGILNDDLEPILPEV